MTTKMPRGAIPTPRFELAASEPYRPEVGTEVWAPSGEFPSPNHELAEAQPYRAGGAVRDSYVGWPIGIGAWGNETGLGSTWAEEAFAKACVEPKVLVPAEVVLFTSRECGSSNFARFMQVHGFQMNRKAYLDGPFNSVDWSNTAALNGAIANVGPVKIGVASANLSSAGHGRITPGTSGWGIYGLSADKTEGHCASLCGYGPLAVLVDFFKQHRVGVNLPLGMPTGLCYVMFTSSSVGIIDRQSLVNITGEAWVRNPTTIVKNLSAY